MTNERNAELARKAVQARRLTDPLGAIGQRRRGDRIEREARWRRGMFAGSLAVFAASFALVTATGTPGHDAPAADPAPASEVTLEAVALAPVQANAAPLTAAAAPSATPDLAVSLAAIMGGGVDPSPEVAPEISGTTLAQFLGDPGAGAATQGWVAPDQQANADQSRAKAARKANARTRSS